MSENTSSIWDVLEVPEGVNATVDLTSLFEWEGIRYHQGSEYRGIGLVDELVYYVTNELEHDLTKNYGNSSHNRRQRVVERLREALEWMIGTLDDHVEISIASDSPAGYIKFTAWCSLTQLPWRVQAELPVRVYGNEIRATNLACVTLTTKDWGGGAITYTDVSRTLADIVTEWLNGYTGRLGIRKYAMLDFKKTDHFVAGPPTIEQFASKL